MSDSPHTLMNPEPLLKQLKTFIAKAHSGGDMLLELFLLSLQQQIKELAAETCLVIFSGTCLGSAAVYKESGPAAIVMVKIKYPSGITLHWNKPFFMLMCTGQASEMAMKIPLSKGDDIRVLGRIHSCSHRIGTYSAVKFFIVSEYIELIRKQSHKIPENWERGPCLQ